MILEAQRCMCDANHEATIASKHLCASAYDMLAGDASKRFDAIVDKRAFEHAGMLVSTNFDHTTINLYDLSAREARIAPRLHHESMLQESCSSQALLLSSLREHSEIESRKFEHVFLCAMKRAIQLILIQQMS